jgi:putative transposase
MIDPEHVLPISKQAEELQISRSTVYYHPRPISDADLFLMRRIDELHLDYPFAGSRMLRDMLSQQGLEVGRRHVRTLMRRMAIETLYRKPNTSKPAPGHRIYPYLLRGLAITRPNQVWAMDITYIPMARGFVYLAAVLDWFSRRVLAWQLSITMDTSFCIQTLEEAIRIYGRPEIQHRPGLAVHQRSLHWAAKERRHRDQHGWQGPLGRQRLRRAAVALAQIRARLSSCL